MCTYACGSAGHRYQSSRVHSTNRGVQHTGSCRGFSGYSLERLQVALELVDIAGRQSNRRLLAQHVVLVVDLAQQLILLASQPQGLGLLRVAGSALAPVALSRLRGLGDSPPFLRHGRFADVGSLRLGRSAVDSAPADSQHAVIFVITMRLGAGGLGRAAAHLDDPVAAELLYYGAPHSASSAFDTFCSKEVPKINRPWNSRFFENAESSRSSFPGTAGIYLDILEFKRDFV